MAINFPNNPTLNQEFTSGDNTWVWSGISWNIKPLGSTLNDLSDVDTASASEGQLLAFNGTTWTPVSLTGTFNGGTITGSLFVNNNTASTSTTSGALRVAGGAGIVGALNVGSTLSVGGNTSITGSISATTEISVSGGPVSVRGNNRLRLYDTDNTNFIGLRSPANLTSDFTYIFPSSYGTAGQFLQSNGTGGLTWATPAGGDGGGVTNPPGGVAGSIQYNNGSNFGGSPTFTYDSGNDTISLTNLDISGNVTTADLTITNSISTVDLTASGSITGNIVSGNVSVTGGSISGTTQASLTTLSASGKVSFTNSTSSTSSTTGAVVVTGGVGISQNVYVGGQVSVNTTITANGNIASNANISANNNITAGGNITAGQNVIINSAPSTANHATNKQYVDSRSIAISIAMS